MADLFKRREIRKLKIQYFIRGPISDVCDREEVEKAFYHIDSSFRPAADLVLEPYEWLYLVNFYGQFSNDELKTIVEMYVKGIIDQANDYFADPIPRADTFYTCRK